jgi:hypothetical protein
VSLKVHVNLGVAHTALQFAADAIDELQALENLHGIAVDAYRDIYGIFP